MADLASDLPSGRTSDLHDGFSDTGGATSALLYQMLAEQRLLAQAVERLVGTFGERQAWLPESLKRTIAQPAADPGQTSTHVAGREASGITVSCLGGFDVRFHGAPMPDWKSGRARGLFQYLVTHMGRPTSRETLIDALWPDPGAVAAGTSLKVAVHALRQALREVALTGPAASCEVVVQKSGYQLLAPSVWLDVNEFERLCTGGARCESGGRQREALALYRQAVELYRGDFLAESWDDWVVLRREGLKDQYLFALGRLADSAFALGEYHECIGRCRQILDQDRCREDAFRTLMSCHARLGQPGRARRWYEICARVLRTELDAEPAPETVRLLEHITASGDGVLPDHGPATGRTASALTAR